MPFEFVGGNIFTEHAAIPACQQHDMQMDTLHIVNHVAEFDDVLLRLKFEFVGFSHGLSGIRFYPCFSRRKPAHYQAVMLKLLVPT